MELSTGCHENFRSVAKQLITMHHSEDPQIAKEWEVREGERERERGREGGRGGGVTRRREGEKERGWRKKGGNEKRRERGREGHNQRWVRRLRVKCNHD